MKKVISLSGFLAFTFLSFGQNTNWQLTGNTGTNSNSNFIGTTDNKALVFKTNGTEKFRIDPDGGIEFTSIGSGINSTYFSTDNFYGNWINFNTNSPNIGAGTGVRFNLNSEIKSQIFFNGGAFSYGTTIDGVVGNTDVLSRTGDVYLSTGIFLSNGLVVKNGTGNIGMGTTNPLSRLHVNGNIFSNGKILIGVSDANTATKIAPYALADGSAIFTKATVKLSSVWPDYVFAPDYQLTPIDSLENYIKTKGHLPEMPTAKEVKKDGIDLGATQALLLKKIEELTLIIIEQNKRITELERKQQ